MRRSRRERAMTLMEILFILPVLAAGFAVTFQITSRAAQLQRRTLADLRDDARQGDLLRRIGQDAAGARTAKLERGGAMANSSDDGHQVVVLRLEGCSPTTLPADDAGAATVGSDVTILYRVAANHVTRTEAQGATAVSYEWSFDSSRVDLDLESIAGEPRVVWVSFIKHRQRQQGPELVRTRTAAARIGTEERP